MKIHKLNVTAISVLIITSSANINTINANSINCEKQVTVPNFRTIEM